jgi:endonuclease G
VLALVLIKWVVDAVERAAGITIFSDAVKQASKHICVTTKCEVTVRRFDDARKTANKAIGGPKR